MFVRMRRSFAYDQENGTRRTIPSGWAGNLDDEIAQRAIDGGYTSEPASPTPDSLTGQTVGERVAPTGDGTPRRDQMTAEQIGQQNDPQGGQQTGQSPSEAAESMSRAELDELARARGIDPDGHRTKADLVAAINGA